MQDNKATIEETFEDYLLNARNDFNAVILKYFPHEVPNRAFDLNWREMQADIRVACENILLAYDQMRERLSSPVQGIKSKVTAKDILDMHTDGRRFTTENILAAMKEFASREVLEYAKGESEADEMYQEEIQDNAIHGKIAKWLTKQSEGMKVGEKYPYPDVVDLIFQYVKESSPSPVQGIKTPEEIIEDFPHLTGTMSGDESRLTIKRKDLFAAMQAYHDQFVQGISKDEK